LTDSPSKLDPDGLTLRAQDTGRLLALSARSINKLTTIEEGVRYAEAQGALQPMLVTLTRNPGLTDHAIECITAFHRVTTRNTMRSLRVQIMNCVNLAKADIGRDMSDPYVLVFWNGNRIGNTAFQTDNHDPIWEDESFMVSLPTDTAGCELRLEVRDFDLETSGRGVMLGQVTIEGSSLMDCLSDETQQRPLVVTAFKSFNAAL
jgi:Ca2+-dependent lipid-binding protein